MKNFSKVAQGFKKIMDRESRKKAAKEAAMEAKKVKVQDETDMLDVQGAKDGGRMGYKGGGMSQRGLGRAFMKGGKV